MNHAKNKNEILNCFIRDKWYSVSSIFEITHQDKRSIRSILPLMYEDGYIRPSTGASSYMITQKGIEFIYNGGYKESVKIKKPIKQEPVKEPPEKKPSSQDKGISIRGWIIVVCTVVIAIVCVLTYMHQTKDDKKDNSFQQPLEKSQTTNALKTEKEKDTISLDSIP